jgi:hypothetical protein
MSKLGSMGDLTSLFEFNPSAAALAADAPQPAPQQQHLVGLAGKSLPGASLLGGGVQECGVDTPPLSSSSEGELLCVPDMMRVPKRRRT